MAKIIKLEQRKTVQQKNGHVFQSCCQIQDESDCAARQQAAYYTIIVNVIISVLGIGFDGGGKTHQGKESEELGVQWVHMYPTGAPKHI